VRPNPTQLSIAPLDRSAIWSALETRYASVWSSLLELRERWMRDHGVQVAWPMLVGPTESYATSRWRILVVGRETNDWAAGTPNHPLPFSSVSHAMQVYADFTQQGYGGDWRRTLWHLHNAFNSTGPTLSVLTTNLFRMDVSKGTPEIAFQAALANIPGVHTRCR